MTSASAASVFDQAARLDPGERRALLHRLLDDLLDDEDAIQLHREWKRRADEARRDATATISSAVFRDRLRRPAPARRR